MRPVTLFTGQWADLPFETLCQMVSQWGYDGLEIACWGDHMDIEKAATDPAYCEEKKAILKKNHLKTWALGTHIIGQCVADRYDPRLDGFAPSELAGNSEAIREWGIKMMTMAPQAAKNMDCDIITGFTGSPVWAFWYSFPQTSQEMVDAGFKKVRELWDPIFDEFDKYGVKFALEVHPTEIAFDYYSTQKLLETFEHRKTLGINFDPSHLLWQGMTPHLMIRDFPDRIYHVHMKDAAVRLDGRSGILGSHMEFGDNRRGWNFRSLGHGDVDFEEIIRELNAINYQGPLSVEWEDSGMDRVHGAMESLEFVRQVDFKPSDIAFDDAIKSD